jgi:hypothetical protein
VANKKHGKKGNKGKNLVDRLRLGGISKSAANAIAGAIPGLGKGGKGKKQGKKGKK